MVGFVGRGTRAPPTCYFQLGVIDRQQRLLERSSIFYPTCIVICIKIGETFFPSFFLCYTTNAVIKETRRTLNGIYTRFGIL